MGRLLSIAAGVSPDTGPVDFVAAAAAAGWPACGIWFDAATWTDSVGAEVRRRLDDTGLVALDMEPVFVTPADGGPPGATTDVGARIIEAAASVGARNVLVVGRGVDVGPFTERFGELCDLDAPSGINCVVEFMAFMSIRRLPDALDVVRTVDRPNAAVLVDNLHLARTGGTAADLRDLDPSLLPYVQLCDAPADLVGDLIVEALDERSAPGRGGLPVAEVVAALPVDTPLSMEVRSARLRADFSDPTDRARHLLDQTREFFDQLDTSGAAP